MPLDIFSNALGVICMFTYNHSKSLDIL